MRAQKIKYSKHDPENFFKEVRRRVFDYFKAGNISQKGNNKVYLKALVCLAVLLVPYFMILFWETSEITLMLLCIVVGFGMALVGMNVMHDACHGSFSDKKWINRIAADTIYLLGADKLVWQVSHNVIHHSFTNIHGRDVDLEAGRGIIRFSRHAPWKPINQYQHIYAFFLYTLLVFNWVFLTDFLKHLKFTKEEASYNAQPTSKSLTTLIFYKIFAYTFWLVIPFFVLKIAFWKIIFGLFLVHVVAGLILTLVFQLAHLTAEVDTLVPDTEGNMENSWAIHQLETTANWARKSKLLTWAVGGLNYQIEHHLFPGINHIHYPEIASIVKQTTEEFGFTYYEFETLGSALASHYQYLKEMGQEPKPERMLEAS